MHSYINIFEDIASPCSLHLIGFLKQFIPFDYSNPDMLFESNSLIKTYFKISYSNSYGKLSPVSLPSLFSFL